MWKCAATAMFVYYTGRNTTSSSSAAADVGSSGKLCACRNAVCSRPGACMRASCSDRFIWRCVNSEWVDFDPRAETLHM